MKENFGLYYEKSMENVFRKLVNIVLFKNDIAVRIANNNSHIYDE